MVVVEKPEPREERSKHLYAQVMHKSEKLGKWNMPKCVSWCNNSNFYLCSALRCTIIFIYIFSFWLHLCDTLFFERNWQIQQRSLNLNVHQNQLEDLLKQVSDPHHTPQFSDSIGLQWGLRICISNNFKWCRHYWPEDHCSEMFCLGERTHIQVIWCKSMVVFSIGSCAYHWTFKWNGINY